MISLKNVTYFYQNHKNPSIKNINIDIKKGEFVVLTGNSGCGKTTVTRVVNGLAQKFYEGKLSGQVIVNDFDISKKKLWELGKDIGSVFQDPKSQFFATLVEDEVAFGCENYGVDENKIDDRVYKSLKMVNGLNLSGKELFSLSSGEKQKIAIASISALSPDIYVFDEPSANLDMYSVEQLKQMLEYLKMQGKTILISEHRLYYLKNLVDKYIYMKDGEIKYRWNKEEVDNITTKTWESFGLRHLDLKKIDDLKLNNNNVKNKTCLEIKNLDFNYKKDRIFNKLNLTFKCGEITCITGENGAGKTTLAKILCGLLKENGGSLEYKNKPLNQKERRKISYFVSQNTDCQLFTQSVEEELLLSNEVVDAKDVLKNYGLQTLTKCHPSTLSGGERQRLTLAVADVINRDILIFDEPTSGVDKNNMNLISKRLKELASKGKIIIVITHDYEFIKESCENVVLINSKEKIEKINVLKDSKTLLVAMTKNMRVSVNA
ncbi:ABC transporter ATP-binding protein [Terrisporobacter glycolicus]|nr:ABC transporter ATP-binding protein [Terrisporobacter glycolicus]